LGSLFGSLAILTRDDIGGVPSRPVVLGGRRFVLAMMFLCLAQKLSHRRNVKVTDSSSWQPRCDFLQQPAVAVRIMEGSKREVTGMGRVWTAGPQTSKQVGLIGPSVHVAAVEHWADLDAPTEQLFPGGLDVGDG